MASMPDWNDEDLVDLGPTLGSQAETWRNQKKRAEMRIAWDAVGYIASTGYSSCFALHGVEPLHLDDD